MLSAENTALLSFASPTLQGLQTWSFMDFICPSATIYLTEHWVYLSLSCLQGQYGLAKYGAEVKLCTVHALP